MRWMLILGAFACGGGEDEASPVDDTSADTDAGGDADPDCDSFIVADFDGARVVACEAEVSPGGLNHVSGTLEDGRIIVVNMNGQVPAEGVCLSISLRSEEGGSLDWLTAPYSCDGDLTEYGERIVGTFAGTLEPVEDPSLGAIVVTNGRFDVPLP